MSLILLIETATEICSVALQKDGKLLAKRESSEEKVHSTSLTIFIQEILTETNIKINDIDAVAVSSGPGSYTGLRIGAATAKAISYALEKSLIAINTLQSLAALFLENIFKPQFLDNQENNVYFCPMLDAKRMEVYCAIFDKNLDFVKPTFAEIVTENSFSEFLETRKVFFFGNGAAKCKSLIKNSNAIFIENFALSAQGMCFLSEKKFLEKNFENIAYFEPFYLKEFQAVIKPSPFEK